MARARPLPVRPSLDTLLAHRGAPSPERRVYASAVMTAIRAHPPRVWDKYVSWALLRATDVPRKRKDRTMSGKIIEETPEQTAAYERAHQAGQQNGHLTPEQQELAERRAAKAQRQDQARARWLDSSGFGTVIETAEALLADLPRAMEEHQRAQASLGDLRVFLTLAAETPEDAVLQRFARRAEDLAKQITTEPMVFGNAEGLRRLISRVKAADLEAPNGPGQNSNVTEAWQRQFRELLSVSGALPPPGHAEHCRHQVAGILREARAARETGR